MAKLSKAKKTPPSTKSTKAPTRTTSTPSPKDLLARLGLTSSEVDHLADRFIEIMKPFGSVTPDEPLTVTDEDIRELTELVFQRAAARSSLESLAGLVCQRLMEMIVAEQMTANIKQVKKTTKS